MRHPLDCEDMVQVRAEIDRLDTELVSLFAQRMRYIDRAAQIKAECDLPARIEDRVEEVIANVVSHAQKHDVPVELIESLWRQLVDWSISREEESLGPDS